MMFNINGRIYGKFLVLLIILNVSGISLFAQSGNTISGTVTDTDGEPIIGATVSIDGTQLGTVTEIDGTYAFSANLDPGDYTMLASSVGYSTQRISISLTGEGKLTQDISMEVDILSLDEVVVTGTSVASSRKQLGNAISTVNAKDIAESGAIGIDQALSGKVAGALVLQNSGDPAGGISIRLRGASTIAGSSDPLYIVDGVIVSNSSNQLVDLGGNTQNRLVDINPADIERIEVIKGAAAAAIYGSRASNGVVQIFTKRGSEGVPKVSLSTSVRINNLRKKIPVNEAPLNWVNTGDRTNLETVPAKRFDYQDVIFDTGIGTENAVSVRGGTDKTKYFFSGSHLYNEGIVKNADFKRYNARLNLDQQLTDWLSFNYGLSYTNSSSNDIPNGGLSEFYGALTGFLFLNNSVDINPDATGIYPPGYAGRPNPLEVIEKYKFGQETNRVISNFGMTLSLDEGLSATYRFGADFYNQSATGFIPVGNTSAFPDGWARRGDANAFQYNHDLNVIYETNISSAFTSTSMIGGTWQGETFDVLALTSRGLAPTVQTADGGSIISQGDTRTEVAYWGVFAQQTFGLNEKIFVTGALRSDGASVFSKDERNQLYAKVSGSYLISNEDFWQNSIGNIINSMKLRASWGQAGNLTAIGAYDRFSNFNTVNINGAVGIVPASLLGNEKLAPERQEEMEFGTDVSFLNGKVGLEFTYYEQKVTDLLVRRELAASTGYTSKFENVGKLENKGIEILLRANPVKTPKFKWNLTAVYGANENKVTEIEGERITLDGSFGTSFVIPGEALGVFYRQFYARNPDGSLMLDANGYPSGGINEDGTKSKVIGDPNPDWTGSLINEFEYKNFSLRVQFDAVQGFDVFNWNRRLLDNDLFGGGANVGKELLGQRLKDLGGAQAGIFEEFVEDGSFVKLRELALGYTYNLNSDIFESIRFTIVGRNLLSFDNYTSWDPELNTPGQSNGVRGFDFAAVPIPSTWQFGVNVNF